MTKSAGKNIKNKNGHKTTTKEAFDPNARKRNSKARCKLATLSRGILVSLSVQSLLWIALDRFAALSSPMKIQRISYRFRVFAIVST